MVGSMLLGSFQSALLPQSLRNTDGFMAEMALLSLDAEPPRAGTELPARGMRRGGDWAEGDTEVSFALSTSLGAPFADELTVTLPWCTPGSPFLTWKRLLLPQRNYALHSHERSSNIFIDENSDLAVLNCERDSDLTIF